jgi:CheY-like chemotaxis protein
MAPLLILGETSETSSTEKMKKRTILFVEDNEAILENTLEILELHGYRVLGAPNGKKGVEMAFEHLPDLIISDIQIPVIDGYEFLKELKKNPSTSDIPFVFLSASAQREDIEKGKMSGATAYLVKPILAEELQKVISEILS